MKSVFVNLTLFKAGWLACVFGAAAGAPLIGLAAVAVAVAVRLLQCSDARGESLLLLLAVAMGLSWESTLVASGIVSYDVGTLLPGIAPYWIVAMWVLLATTLNAGMRWLRNSLPLAVAAGGIGGPMSFLAGQQAGAVSFGDTGIALLVIGLGWAVLLPAMVRAAVWIEDAEHRSAPLRAQTQGEES